MLDIVLIILAASLVNNIVVEYLLGVSPLLSVSRKEIIARDLSIAIIYVMTLTGLIISLVNQYILQYLSVDALRYMIVLTAVIIIVQTAHKPLQKRNTDLGKITSRFTPLLMMNSVLLATALLTIESNVGFVTGLAAGFGTGIGFAIVQMAFAALDSRLQYLDVPAGFRGLSIQLITLGIIAMAFLGFTGLTSI